LGIGLGVAALAGVAFVLTRKDEKKAEPAAAPTTPRPPSGGITVVSDAGTVKLKKGQYYRGRMNLTSPLTNLLPFVQTASEETIAKGLVAIGFVDVRVYMNVSDLPQDWPRDTAMNTQAGTRWFQGQWTGVTGTLPKPPVMEMVWEGPGQSVAVSGMTG
jgi:hypothetical protein